jgi:ABC-type transport system substrate-binding protein
MHFSRRWTSLWALLLVALLAAGCSPAAAPSAPAAPATGSTTPAAGDVSEGDAAAEEAAAPEPAQAGEKVVRVDTSQGKGTFFNPVYLVGTGSQYHTFPWIWMSLTIADANGQQIPHLAESFEPSPDASVWTFHLPENATWSDGTPMTADDLVFSYHLRLDPEFMSALGLDWAPGWHIARLGKIKGYEAFASGDAESIEGIQAVDAHTFVIELDEPNAVLPIGTQHLYALPKHVLGELTAEEFAAHPYVTTMPDPVLGPLRLARYEVDEFIELERNPEWWGEEQLKIDRIIFYQADEQANINRVLAGEQDIVMRGIGADDLLLFEGQEFLRQEPVLSLGWSSIGTNARDREYMTKELRQALLYATDRDTINQVLYNGEAVKVNSIILGPEWAIPDDLEPYDYSPDKAREILASIGWDSSQTLVYLITDPEDILAPLLQQMWAEVGVTVELSLRSPSDLTNVLTEGDYDVHISGGGSAAADPSLSASYVACNGSGTERLGYCNEELDAFFAAGLTVPDIEGRAPSYHEAARILNEDLPYIALFRTPLFYIINNRLQGIVPAASVDDLTWNLYDWDVVE